MWHLITGRFDDGASANDKRKPKLQRRKRKPIDDEDLRWNRILRFEQIFGIPIFLFEKFWDFTGNLKAPMQISIAIHAIIFTLLAIFVTWEVAESEGEHFLPYIPPSEPVFEKDLVEVPDLELLEVDPLAGDSSASADMEDLAGGNEATLQGPEDELKAETITDMISTVKPSPVVAPTVTKAIVSGKTAQGTGLGGGGKGTGTGKGVGSGGRMGKVFGMKVSSNRLGVLLDVSGSMHDILPEVMLKIDEQFEDYVLVMVVGCNVSPRLIKGEFESVLKMSRKDYDGLIPEKLVKMVKRKKVNSHFSYVVDAGSALEFMTRQGVDSIYWFADFQDSVDPKRMTQVGRNLEIQRVSLYVHSLEKQPASAIRKATFETRGDFVVKNIK